MTSTDSLQNAVVLLTDIVWGPDAAIFQFGDFQYHFERHDELLHASLGKSQTGNVLIHSGDGYVVVFEVASEAVSFALRFQNLIQATWPGGLITVRIGIHVGECSVQQHPILKRKNLFGLAVNVATRVMALASGGQILVTQAVFALARSGEIGNFVPDLANDDPAKLRFVTHGKYRLQGVSEEVEIYEVGLEGSAPFAISRSSGAMRVTSEEQITTYYSCFISYSSTDEDFARKLYRMMGDAKLRRWFAPEDIKGGRKLHEQIDAAIRVYDKLLIVLSEASLRSEWVMTELRKARQAERQSGKRKLFPVRLVDMEKIRDWKCFDADSGKDLAVELREYFIPDFSNWKNDDQFETAFSRLLKDLRAEERAT